MKTDHCKFRKYRRSAIYQPNIKLKEIPFWE